MALTEKSCLDEVDQIVTRVEKNLPLNLPVPSVDIENDQTVEVEREIKTEVERETQIEMEEEEENFKDKDYLYGLWSHRIKEFDSFPEAISSVYSNGSLVSADSTGGIPYPIFPLKSYLEKQTYFDQFSSDFDGINIAINILESYGGPNWDFLDSHRPTFHHLLIKDSKVSLLTQFEAAEVYNSPDYYNLTTGFINEEKNKSLTDDEREKIVKVKFLNGESHYTQQEKELLKGWFQNKEKTQRLEKLFREKILLGYPLKAARFWNSPLQDLFEEMLKS
jgi:hypothetical protein